MDMIALVKRLAMEEGLVLTVYDDATGKPLKRNSTCKGEPTIGIGRCLSTHGITAEEAKYLLANDLAKLHAQCANNLGYWKNLNDVQQNVVMNMCFNLGFAGFRAFHLLEKALCAENYALAAAEIKASIAATEAPARYDRLAKEMATGKSQGINGEV